MLNIEQIENIIKSKYNDLVITSTDCFIGFIFDNKDIASHQEIIFYFDSKDKLYYEKKIWNAKTRCQNCNFAIENNAIELKHYLDIEITQQDFIDFLLSIDFIKINKTNIYESKKIKKSENSNCYSFYSVDFDISNKTYKLSSFTKVSANNESALYGDCFMQGKDYWKLYNVIKNLKD